MHWPSATLLADLVQGAEKKEKKKKREKKRPEVDSLDLPAAPAVSPHLQWMQRPGQIRGRGRVQIAQCRREAAARAAEGAARQCPLPLHKRAAGCSPSAASPDRTPPQSQSRALPDSHRPIGRPWPFNTPTPQTSRTRLHPIKPRSPANWQSGTQHARHHPPADPLSRAPSRQAGSGQTPDDPARTALGDGTLEGNPARPGSHDARCQ